MSDACAVVALASCATDIAVLAAGGTGRAEGRMPSGMQRPWAAREALGFGV